jgi:hypothetical protein
MAKPQAGSRKRVEYAAKEPATGKRTAISPRAWTVEYNMTPMRPKAIRTEAGPPVLREDPDPTKRPVPTVVSEEVEREREVYGHTDGTTNGNHLQVTALESPLQGRVCGGLGGTFAVEDLAICANGTTLGDMRIGVALEGVPDATTHALLGGFVLAIDGSGLLVGGGSGVMLLALGFDVFIGHCRCFFFLFLSFYVYAGEICASRISLRK